MLLGKGIKDQLTKITVGIYICGKLGTKKSYLTEVITSLR